MLNKWLLFLLSPTFPQFCLSPIMYGSWWPLLGGADHCLVLYCFISCVEALAITTAWFNNIVEPVHFVADPAWALRVIS